MEKVTKEPTKHITQQWVKLEHYEAFLKCSKFRPDFSVKITELDKDDSGLLVHCRMTFTNVGRKSVYAAGYPLYLHIVNRVPNRTHTFVNLNTMENKTENTEEQKFVDAYKLWLEQKPTSDTIEFVDFQGLCILKSEQEQDITTRNLVNSSIKNVTAPNALVMYKGIQSNVMQLAFEKINQLLEEKTLSNN